MVEEGSQQVSGNNPGKGNVANLNARRYSNSTTMTALADPPDLPSGNASGLLRSVTGAALLGWNQPSGKPTAQVQHAAAETCMDSEVEDDIGHIAENQSRRIVKDDSFVTTSTESSQEYEDYWKGLCLSADDIEEVAANAERAARSNVASPVSRESSPSSLGKRPRSGSMDAGSQESQTYKEVDENFFIATELAPVACPLPPSPVTIAQYPKKLACLFERLARGVQWEIARLVSAGLITYTDVVPHLDKLKGNNEDAAPKVILLLRPLIGGDVTEDVGPESVNSASAERLRKSPWPELDYEETAFRQDHLAGLGFSRNYPPWYGGQVQFTARLKETQKGKPHSSTVAPYKIILQKPELGPSNRLARRFGSWRIIRVRVPKKILMGSAGNTLVSYFKRSFLLSGRVFQAFYARDNNVFLVETDDTTPESHAGPAAQHMRFLDFLHFHNPIGCNSAQVMAKWGARFALGLSNSVPGIMLRPQDIHRIPDIVAPFVGEGKPPADKIMTDGCGWINVHALRMLQARLQWDRLPPAVQFRLDGAKGLLSLHPDGLYVAPEAPQIWLRPSQTKIQYPDNSAPDPARLVLDVLRPARIKYPARLSAETIINIAHNQGHATAQKRHDALRQLMHDGLRAITDAFTQWAGPGADAGVGEAIPLLWHEISRAGGVMGVRMARAFSGSARARGFAERWDDEDGEDEDDALGDIDSQSALPGGHPATLEETAMRLLDAGFRPGNQFLNDKLKFIVRKAIMKYTQRYRIDVPCSAEVFCVPDPKGVLEPGEVHLGTSIPVKSQNGTEACLVLGDVLVARHPCKLPSDIQKVRAVYKPELHQYNDVIIFSTKGEQSLASLLAGGDYDGDTVIVIWEPTLVESFVNADVTQAPGELDSNFEREANETVREFQHRTSLISSEAMSGELQNVLLASLRDTAVVGSYSIWHDNAVYLKGYDHPETKRLAFMFCSCLDGAKTGLRVRSSLLKADKQQWDRRGPSWKETDEPISNEKPLTRDSHLGEFIMDDLKAQGRAISDRVFMKWDALVPPDVVPDTDLVGPWIDAESRAAAARKLGCMQFGAELDEIRAHVQRVRAKYLEAWREQMSPAKTRLPISPNVSHPTNPANVGLRLNWELALEFARGPDKLVFFPDSQREELKASYAYLLDTKRTPFSTFAFKISFRALLRIKAEAAHGIPVAPNFHRCFDIQSGIKALSRRVGR